MSSKRIWWSHDPVISNTDWRLVTNCPTTSHLLRYTDTCHLGNLLPSLSSALNSNGLFLPLVSFMYTFLQYCFIKTFMSLTLWDISDFLKSFCTFLLQFDILKKAKQINYYCMLSTGFLSSISKDSQLFAFGIQI